MDNIQKLLLGVLSIAGAIAMLTPTNVDFAAKMGNASPAEGIPVSPPPVMVPVDEGEFTEEATEADDEDEVADDEEEVAFGQPLIDGNPVGADQSQQNPDQSWAANTQSAPNNNYDYGQGGAQNYNIGSLNMSAGAPPPDISVPTVDMGQ
jgi:hypothetical protein